VPAEMMGIASLRPSYGKTKGAPQGAPFAILGLSRATLRARTSCANRGFAGTKASAHFAQTGPVLGDRPRADLCILLLPDPCPMISLGLDLCPCILHGPGSSVLFRGPNLRCLLHHPYRRRLCGSGLCPCLFSAAQAWKLLEQFFGEGLADLG
jgi:hypothetical protein